MKPTFEATRAALEHFDTVDEPALLKTGVTLVQARRAAADRVRAAFLADRRGETTPEMVELLSVDDIRRTVQGTLAGKLLALFP